ncbi:tetratricopeptide repeat-containing sulfotransferase family protein [Prochlorococcus sp. MIT 0801]|uniref:tetratricopeptide repeat-containing sulfotransferase family protein n=1 Tax=Prochlorococcus sp. MIT 0801 TaxID=1501269 RepID=UPI0004F5F8CC|nr:tetratricopeptide repeat-containing sulfotransferase family protein [Prochlorococcus sp. MIT 0801]AIQ96130.1 TPR repeat [Prochlorococcus sp. MIT 0801]
MDSSTQEGGEKKKVTEVKTFPVPFASGEIKENLTININTISKLSQEKIINQAIQFNVKGNISEAIKYYQYFINQGFNDHRVFSNYGIILKDLGKLQEAELSTRKAIALKPDFVMAHSNLGNVLRDLGKLQDAELSYRKAIALKPDYAMAHSNLGNVLRDLGKLQDAELSYRKAIALKPDFAMAHSNLGNVLRDLGKLQDAELSYRKAIALKPDYAMAHSNLGVLLNDLGKLQDAELSYRKAIALKPDYAMAHSNLGNVLRDLGKLQDAELSQRKAIALKPDFAMAHSNLGNVLRDLGKLQDAELSYRKAIELNPDFAKAYYSLSLINYSDENKIWQDQLLSKNILKNKLQKNQVDIYFAIANILHKEKNYKESSRYLKLANKLKLDINPSKPKIRFNKSKALLIESDKKEINKKASRNSSQSIFIVGMPRCGSTLLESILSMSNDVYDLGEINILEESFLEYKKSKQDINLADLYKKKVNNKTEMNITTNKWLYNYQYAGIIHCHIPNAYIIHCYRNPLDNILSIYRTHFANGNDYSSCLVDCTRVYLDQEDLMTKYKNRFKSKIYDLNYDSLVNNPKEEIKSLISWLGWKWQDSFLTPHLNPRSVSTASSVQVRSPINSKSIGGWKNYKDMLKPAIEILTQTDKYKDIAS